jgi:hypothetical protein
MAVPRGITHGPKPQDLAEPQKLVALDEDFSIIINSLQMERQLLSMAAS